MTTQSNPHFIQGQEHQKQGKIQEAMEAYQQAVAQDYPPAHVCLGFLYYTEFEEYDKALTHLKLAYPHYPKLAYNLGFVYFKKKAFPEAIHFYKRAIEADVSLAHIQLGYIYEGLQEYVEAIMHYQMALFKGEHQANLLLGQLYEQMEEWDHVNFYYSAITDSVIETFVKELECGTPPGGRSRKRLKSYKEQLDRELRKRSLALGKLHEKDGHYVDALVCYQNAIEQGDNRGYQEIESLIGRYLNDFDCLHDLKEAVKQQVTEAFYYLAKLYDAKNDRSNALMAIKKYNQLAHKRQQKGLEFLNTLFEKM